MDIQENGEQGVEFFEMDWRTSVKLSEDVKEGNDRQGPGGTTKTINSSVSFRYPASLIPVNLNQTPPILYKPLHAILYRRLPTTRWSSTPDRSNTITP